MADHGPGMPWEQGTDDTTEDEGSSAGGGAPTVFVLHCKACATVLCRRAMRVSLVSDESTTLLSTDFAPSATSAAACTRQIETCRCRVVDLFCYVCTRSRRANSRANARARALGYHVVQPCEECLAADHNDHFFMFVESAVDAVPLPAFGLSGGAAHLQSHPMTWNQLGTFDGARSPVVLAGEAELPAKLVCPICFEVLRDAVRVEPCGHAFCEVCLIRHVDRWHQCPLDRRQISSLDVVPDLEARRAVGKLRVHCRYGCVRTPAFLASGRAFAESGPAGEAATLAEANAPACTARCAEWDAGLSAEAWAPSAEPGACRAVCALSRIASHERRCPMRCGARSCRGRGAQHDDNAANTVLRLRTH